MKLLHKRRSITSTGEVSTVITRCGVRFFGLQGTDLKKLMEERVTDGPRKVTCGNCLRNL
jgi:hypothetical protein